MKRTISPPHRSAVLRGPAEPDLSISRIQTGVRIERRILLVLKALAGAHDLTLGDLLEGICLHAFEGKAPFGPDSLEKIAALRVVYGLDLTAADSHLLVEKASSRRSSRT